MKLIKKEKSHKLSGQKTEYVYSTIKNMIVSYQWLPGEKHSILEVSNKLNISRTPVSDAIKMLASEGLVTILPHKGFEVGQTASIKDIEELHEIKTLLEGLAAYKAAYNASDEEKELLKTILRKQQIAIKNMDVKTTSVLDKELHFTIFDMAKSKKLKETIAPLWYVGITYDSWIVDQSQLDVIYEEHEALVGAICKGDADHARSIIESHCKRFLERLLSKASAARTPDFDYISKTEGMGEALLANKPFSF